MERSLAGGENGPRAGAEARLAPRLARRGLRSFSHHGDLDKAHRTREDWERGWSHIAPIFGDLAPRTVTLEHVDAWYHALKVMKSVSEAHRAMKIWRALWNVAAAMHYCSADEDPSLGIRRETPKGRSATWEEGEVVRLVKAAWRRKYHGLACIIAIAYDAQFAPVDSRSLRLQDSRDDGLKLWFEIDRAKTGRDALATLSRRTQALVRAYVATLPDNILPTSPIFMTRRGAAYTKNSLAKDFRDIRKLVLPGGHAAVAGHAPDRGRGGTIWWCGSQRHLAEDGEHGGVVRAPPEDLSAGQSGRRRAGGRGPETGPEAYPREQVGAKS